MQEGNKEIFDGPQVSSICSMLKGTYGVPARAPVDGMKQRS